jgi:hypothetical protein
MIRANNGKRKYATATRSPVLLSGVKVVPAPRSAVRRKLLSGPDIATSGGARTVHSQCASR